MLASSQHAAHPYAHWLADLSVPLLAIGDETAPPTSTFAEVTLSSSWDAEELVARALALHESFGFDRVIGLGEVDIVPAARIRERLDLMGQREDSAWVYRDKLTMRREAASKGLPVPAFAAADAVDDVVDFIETHGAPVMVKPRMGVGALDIRRVDDPAEAAELSFLDEPDTYLVESFVDGPTFHVDALFLDGEIMVAVPCAYIGAGCISHWTDGGNGSYTLSPESPLAERLVAATARIARSFPGPPDLAIHAEFFLYEDEILLCEVASRGGGGTIPLTLRRRLGADIRQLWARAQCNLPIDWGGIHRQLEATPLVAGFGLPRRNGQLLALPDVAPPGVEDLEFRASAGEHFSGTRYARRHSGDFVAAWTVSSDHEADLLNQVDATAAEMESLVVWSTAVPAR
ncbi:MAG TPA: hypothetical protein VFM51_09835 [Solirubrobacterales bacterium]|nr:hypothetical protein [Solirubrobacterales bacterium]